MTDHRAKLEVKARAFLDDFDEPIERPVDVDSLTDLLLSTEADVLEEADEQTITGAMREADRVFQKVGGSTRHYVRDCLLPIMKKHGLIVVRQQAQERRP